MGRARKKKFDQRPLSPSPSIIRRRIQRTPQTDALTKIINIELRLLYVCVRNESMYFLFSQSYFFMYTENNYAFTSFSNFILPLWPQFGQ